ncbi:unnamed protein product, partial [marine sediment metagenome]
KVNFSGEFKLPVLREYLIGECKENHKKNTKVLWRFDSWDPIVFARANSFKSIPTRPQKMLAEGLGATLIADKALRALTLIQIESSYRTKPFSLSNKTLGLTTENIAHGYQLKEVRENIERALQSIGIEIDFKYLKVFIYPKNVRKMVAK